MSNLNNFNFGYENSCYESFLRFLYDKTGHSITGEEAKEENRKEEEEGKKRGRREKEEIKERERREK